MIKFCNFQRFDDYIDTIRLFQAISYIVLRSNESYLFHFVLLIGYLTTSRSIINLFSTVVDTFVITSKKNKLSVNIMMGILMFIIFCISYLIVV